MITMCPRHKCFFEMSSGIIGAVFEYDNITLLGNHGRKIRYNERALIKIFEILELVKCKMHYCSYNSEVISMINTSNCRKFYELSNGTKLGIIMFI